MSLKKVLGSPFLYAVKLCLLGSLIFVPPAFAGGQMVAVYADPDGAVNNNGLYLRVIRVYLNPTIPCKGAALTFQFNKPEDGDYIATGSNTSTFTMPEDRDNSGCHTYAKMGSMVKGVRQIQVDARNGDTRYTGSAINVDFDGEYHGDNETNGYMYRSSTTDPYFSIVTNSNPTPPPANINAWILNQEVVPLDSRKVTVKWGAFGGYPGTFTIYAKATTNKNDWEQKFDGSKGPSATFTLRADQDYHIKVHGCMDKFGTCVDSNVLLLPKIQILENKVVFPSPSSVTTTSNNSNTDELNQKIENLQNQLEQSKKTQSVLEQRVNELVNFIKKLFPFFK